MLLDYQVVEFHRFWLDRLSTVCLDFTGWHLNRVPWRFLTTLISVTVWLLQVKSRDFVKPLTAFNALGLQRSSSPPLCWWYANCTLSYRPCCVPSWSCRSDTSHLFKKARLHWPLLLSTPASITAANKCSYSAKHLHAFIIKQQQSQRVCIIFLQK